MVIEYREGGESDDDDEGGQSLEPGVRSLERREGPVGEAREQGPGRLVGWRDVACSHSVSRSVCLCRGMAERLGSQMK